MRRSKAACGWSMVVVAALVLSACGSRGGSGGASGDNGSGPAGSSTDVNTMKTGKSQQGDNYKLGDAPAIDQVTVAIDDSFTAYNQNTPDANTSYNSFVLTAVIAAPYVLDGNNKVLLNTDVMDSVTITNKDPQVVQWKIKPNVKWSDGAVWGCKDFYLSWLAQSGLPKGADGKAAFDPASTIGYSQISDASCKDDLTFEAKFTSPYLDYKGLFTTAWLMPGHILEKQTGIADITKVKPADAADITKAAAFWNKGWTEFKPDIMPGSGPYMITAVDKSKETVTLEKNPMWAGAKGGPKKVLVRAIKDRNAMAAALQNGEIDVAASTQPDATAAGTLKSLSAQGVVYGSGSQLLFEHLDLNYKRIFSDISARKAFMAAVNRTEIVDKLLKPVQADAKPLGGLRFYPNEAGYVDLYTDKAGLGADAAAKILTDAGWAKGPDGIFAKDGKRFSVTITHNTNARRGQTVEIIISQAKAAGIEVKDETDPAFLKGRLSQGGYDIALFGWSAPPFKAEASSIYITKENGGEQNYQGLSDPKVDQALKAGASSTDQAVATKYYQEADKAIADQYASLPLFAIPSMWAFKGIDRVYMQSYFGAMWNVGEWAKTDR